MSLDLKELLKIAEDNKEVLKKKSKKGINDVHSFILTLNIKQGKYKVRPRMVYEAYKHWSGNPLTQRKFFYSFALLFTEFLGSRRYYKLNYSPIELLNKIDNLKIKVK